MRLPFKWLKEFVAVTASAEEVAHRLTMLGLEVEALERTDEDTVFEINVTPNRPDCLSIIGIAREVSAAYGIPLKFPEHDIVAEPGELDFNVDILDADLCHRYAGRVVRNLRMGSSPDWLKERLEQCGIRPINNVVDITNYVLLEFGHPLHAFDLATIKGHRIRVGTPGNVKGKGEKVRIKTLDGVEREVPEDSLLIWDSKSPVAIAGVMGGIETEVSDDTTDVFIESAYFDPVSVRRTSRLTGLKTEASFRFERGTDIKALKKALDRAAFLMKEVAGGVVYGKIDIYPKTCAPVELSIRYDKVNRILGLNLSEKEITDSLGGLGFKVEGLDGYFRVKPPAYRVDIQRDADIIEEVARVYGYDRIPATLPKATVGIEWQERPEKTVSEKFLNEIKASFLKTGFTEVVNYSFMGLQDIELLRIEKDDERRKVVQIKNPLRAEDSFMRTTLVPALIKNIVHNVSHGNREFRLFEISRVFINDRSGVLPKERNHLAAAFYKEKTRTLYRDDVPDFYVFKGVFEAIIKDLKIYDCSFVRSSEPFLHPGQSADIYIGDIKIGHIGALSPLITDSLDIKAHKPSVFVMELDLDTLAPYALKELRYSPLPKYPYIERDTALIIDESIESSMITKWLESYSSDLIEDVSIFDVYKGRNIPEGKKSIAFNVRYRSSDRTLKDDEVDVMHNALVKYIIGKTKGQLRNS